MSKQKPATPPAPEPILSVTRWLAIRGQGRVQLPANHLALELRAKRDMQARIAAGSTLLEAP